MTKDEYEAVKAAICPYCAAKLPTTLICSDRPVWVHGIPNTSHKYDCIATSFRTAKNGWITE